MTIIRGLQKIFVGNLPWSVGSAELKCYFSKYGHVASTSVIFDKSNGISRGYGFIVFSTRDGYNNAVNKINHLLEGKILKVEPANSN